MNLINFLAVGVKCGDTEIGGMIVGIIGTIYNGIKIGVPIILIIVGMVGMGKAIAQQKEDEIKKAQSTLIKQAVAAVIVFLMFQLVQLGMSALNVKNDSNWQCVKMILIPPKDGDDCKMDDGNGGGWRILNENTNDAMWECQSRG